MDIYYYSEELTLWFRINPSIELRNGAIIWHSTVRPAIFDEMAILSHTTPRLPPGPHSAQNLQFSQTNVECDSMKITAVVLSKCDGIRELHPG